MYLSRLLSLTYMMLAYRESIDWMCIAQLRSFGLGRIWWVHMRYLTFDSNCWYLGNTEHWALLKLLSQLLQWDYTYSLSWPQGCFRFFCQFVSSMWTLPAINQSAAVQFSTALVFSQLKYHRLTIPQRAEPQTQSSEGTPQALGGWTPCHRLSCRTRKMSKMMNLKCVNEKSSRTCLCSPSPPDSCEHSLRNRRREREDWSLTWRELSFTLIPRIWVHLSTKNLSSPLLFSFHSTSSVSACLCAVSLHWKLFSWAQMHQLSVFRISLTQWVRAVCRAPFLCSQTAFFHWHSLASTFSSHLFPSPPSLPLSLCVPPPPSPLGSTLWCLQKH